MNYSIYLMREQATDGMPIWVSYSELPDTYFGRPTYTQGATISEAIDMAQDLERCWCEAYHELGLALPTPAHERSGSRMGGVSVTLFMTYDGSVLQ